MPEQPQTIQATAKKWKLIKLQAGGGGGLASMFLMMGIFAGSKGLIVLGLFGLVVAVGWSIYGGAGEWWHHG